MKHIIIQKAKQIYIPASPKHKAYRRFDPRSLQEDTKEVSKEIVNKMGDVMKLFNQKKNYTCGPASIRIALSAFRKSVTEEELIKISKSTVSYGTSHENIIKAIKKEGLNVIEYKNLSPAHSLHVLKEYTDKGMPVIVGWLKTKLVHGANNVVRMIEQGVLEVDPHPSENSEHYSVVKGVDNKNVYVLDPLEDKEMSMPIDYFMKRWKEFSEQDERWFIVLSTEK